jgi:hypothetical protein
MLNLKENFMKYLVTVLVLLFSCNLFAAGFGNAGVHVQEYLYDGSVDGYTNTTYTLSSKKGYNVLPTGAIVLDVVAKIVTTCATSAGATVAWGPSADADGYSGTTIAAASLVAGTIWHAGSQGSEALLWENTGDSNLFYYADGSTKTNFIVTVSTGALTACKIHFSVLYLLPGSR